MAAQGWDIASETDAPLGSTAPTIPAGWDVAHEEPVETARERMDRHRAMIAKAPSFATSAKRVANDALDVAGNALAVVPTAATGVASDILGQDQATHDKAKAAVHDFIAGPSNPDLGAAGAAFASTDTGKGVSSLVHAAHKGVAAVGGEGLANAVDRDAGDVLPLLPFAGPAARVVGEGTGVVKPAVAAAESTVVPAATAPNEVLKAAGYRISPSTEANMTGAAGAPSTAAKVGETVGGSTAVRAENLKHNRPVTNGWAATDIGLERGDILNEENIAKAEAKPAATYQRVRDALTNRVPVSENTAAALRATNAPDVLGRTMPGEHANSIALISSEPMSGGELMDRISALRQEGYKRTTAAPGGQIDPATEAYGNAQLDAANALEKELNDRVAATNPKLAGDYQAARKLFAKINTVKRSLQGYNVDPSKLAKAAAKTDAIDGGLGIIAHAQTHAPTDIGLHVPAAAGLTDSAAAAGAGGAVGGAIAAGFGHPTTAALLASLPVVQYGVRKALAATRGETAAADLDATAQGPLGAYFGRDDSGFHPSGARGPRLELTPPPGNVFEPHQPSVLRSGENVPVAEQGGLPPSLTLAPPEGQAFEPHQPNVLRTGERVPAAESTQTPQPSVSLTPPPGQAFEAHPPVATSSQPVGGTPTAPQYTLPLGDTVAGGDSVVLHHGTPGKAFTKFDNSKLRSGSGANARGAGTYFSDAEGEPRTFAGDKGGHVVHSTVPADTVDRMLDLDKPLKDQPRVVAALKDVPGVNLNMTGEQLRAKIAETEKLGKTSDEPMAKWLESKGIPGVKYAATKAGKPTGANNYILHNAGRDATVTGSTRVKGGLGDVVADRTKVGGGLSAEDLKLAE